MCWVWGGEIIEMSKYRCIVMDIFVNTHQTGLNNIVNCKVFLQNFSTSGARKQVSIVAGEESSARKKRETLKRQVWGVGQRLSLEDIVLLLTEIFMVQQGSIWSKSPKVLLLIEIYLQDTPIHPDITGAGALIKRPTVLKSLSANTGGDTVRAKTDINILIKTKKPWSLLPTTSWLWRRPPTRLARGLLLVTSASSPPRQDLSVMRWQTQKN